VKPTRVEEQVAPGTVAGNPQPLSRAHPSQQGWRQAIRAALSDEDETTRRLKAIAYAIENMLGVPRSEAIPLARAGDSRRSKFYELCTDKNATQALGMLRRKPLASDATEFIDKLGAHHPTYLLALPVTVSSIIFLAHLLKDSARQFYIIDTPLAQTYLRPLLAAAGNAWLVSAAQMIKHNRARDGAEAITYVTFPDHQTTNTDTMREVPFCGERHLMPVVEPVLFFRGVGPLVTLDASAYDEAGSFGLCEYPAKTPGKPASEADVRAVLGWLAAQVENVFRAAPVEVLSWELSSARSSNRRALSALMKLKAVEGFLRAWHTDGAGFNPEINDWAMTELQRAQSRLIQSLAPARATNEPELKAGAATVEADGGLHTSPLLRQLILRAPAACAQAFKLLADVDYYVHANVNNQLKRNLALAFPGRSDSNLSRIIKRHYRSNYQRMVGTIHISSTSRDERIRYLETHVEIRGAEQFRAACESSDSLLFFTPHYGDYVIGCLRGILEVARFKRLSIFYDPPEKNPATVMYKRLIDSLGCDVNVLYNDKTAVLKGLRAMRNGGALAIMPDVYEINGNAMCVPFFDRLMVAMGGTAFFALKGNARLIPAFCYRRSASRFVLQLDASIEISRTGNFQEDLYRTTVNIFNSIEKQLRVLPEHWAYWNSVQDRFRLASDIELPREPRAWAGHFAALRERFANDLTEITQFLDSFTKKLEPSLNASRPDPQVVKS
jgi:KDO2-lipid IV(A) lauroyltransferase